MYMNCKAVKNKLSAYQDKQLPESQRLLMQEHLKECQQCSFALENLNSVWDELDQVETFESAPFFWTRLSQKINEQKQPVRKSIFNPLQWIPVPILTTAVLILAFFIGIYFGRTIFQQSMNNQQTTIEQEMNELLSINSLDEYTGESLSDAYVSLISDNSQ